MANSSLPQIYQLAGKLCNQQEFSKAEKLLKSLLGTSYHEEALLTLAELYYERSNFSAMRNILNEYREKEHSAYLLHMAHLEFEELNMKKALRYVHQYADKKKDLSDCLFETARIYKSLGKIDSAQTIFEILTEIDDYTAKSLKELWGIFIERQDDEQLKKALKTIPNYYPHYEYYRRLLEVLSHPHMRPTNNDAYSIKRYFASSNELLYEHLEKHIEGNNESDYFFHYVNLPKLLEDIQKKMEKTNPIFHGNTYSYHLRMPSLVGVIHGRLTKDLCVVAHAGNAKIITMYPASFSVEFNREGFLEDANIMQKRKERLK